MEKCPPCFFSFFKGRRQRTTTFEKETRSTPGSADDEKILNRRVEFLFDRVFLEHDRARAKDLHRISYTYQISLVNTLYLKVIVLTSSSM